MNHREDVRFALRAAAVGTAAAALILTGVGLAETANPERTAPTPAPTHTSSQTCTSTGH